MSKSEVPNSAAKPQEANSTPAQFRWRLLPVIYFAFAGGLFSLFAVSQAATMVYVRVSYGPIEPHPSTPSLNAVAPTFPNLIRLISASIAGPAGIIAARWWWKGRWKRAIAASIICALGQIAASQFGSFS